MSFGNTYNRIRHGRRGFTLLELLVVIAIIAVLAAILFPVYSLVKRKAQRTTCVSNMHQLARAMTSYADDNDSKLPHWWFEKSETTWDTAVFPQVKSKDVFECPTNASRVQAQPSWVIRSYAFPRNVSGIDLTSLRRPAETVLLFEKGGQLLFDWGDSTAEFFQQMWSEDDDPKTYPHGAGKNFAYADGHVRWSDLGSGPFTYAFPMTPGSNRTWPLGYCGNLRDPLGTVTNRSDPGANLPR